MAVVWSPTALEKFTDLLLSIGEYSEDPDLPDRLADSLEEYLDKIEHLPLMHRQAEGFPQGVCTTSSKPFVVCYERKNGDLEVVAIYHERSRRSS